MRVNFRTFPPEGHHQCFMPLSRARICAIDADKSTAFLIVGMLDDDIEEELEADGFLVNNVRNDGREEDGCQGKRSVPEFGLSWLN